MKRKPKELSGQEFKVTLDALYTAASVVQGRQAMKNFLHDLLTPSERIMLGRRIIVARMLLRGVLPGEIIRDMRIGRATIWRVQKWLEDQLPGYEQVIEKMEQEFATRTGKAKESLITTLKKRYPLHFLLVPNPKK